MTLHAHEWVSIVELIFYIPTSILALFVCFRHGFKRTSGWIYTLLLCVVRIAGAICQLLAWQNPSSTDLLKATFITDSIGLSPLLLATLGVLSRFVDFINAATVPIFTTMHFRIIQILLIVGLILSIAGGTSGGTNSDGSINVASTSKVGVILFIVSYIAILAVYLLSVRRYSSVPKKERRVPIAIFFALPFVAVRLIYAACSVFLHTDDFNVVTGSAVILFFMAVLEEMIVVVIYLALSFLVDKLDITKQGPLASGQWRDNHRGLVRGRPRYDVEAQQLGTVRASYPPPSHQPRS